MFLFSWLLKYNFENFGATCATKNHENNIIQLLKLDDIYRKKSGYECYKAKPKYN